jgi:hypothetical protein
MQYQMINNMIIINDELVKNLEGVAETYFWGSITEFASADKL